MTKPCSSKRAAPALPRIRMRETGLKYRITDPWSLWGIANWKRQAVENMAGTFSGKAERARTVDDAQIKAMGFKVGCSESYTQSLADLCSCECEARPQEEEIADCEDYCRNEWRQCPLPDHLLTNELAAQVAEYKRLLMSKNSNMPPEMVSDFIEAFKKMPEWQRDLTLQAFK